MSFFPPVHLCIYNVTGSYLGRGDVLLLLLLSLEDGKQWAGGNRLVYFGEEHHAYGFCLNRGSECIEERSRRARDFLVGLNP
jgi:hypothetical protein